MAVQGYVCYVFAMFVLFLGSFCQGYKFYVGGRDGWALNPSESYNNWAGRNRFQVNDTLLFRMMEGEDPVLQVTKENYNECNTKNPIQTLKEEYKFTRSGPHYFISSNTEDCNKGLKIIIVVLAVRPKKTPPAPPSPSVPVASPPPAAPVSPSGYSSPVNEPSMDQKKSSAGVVFGGSLLGVVLSVLFGVFGVMVGFLGVDLVLLY